MTNDVIELRLPPKLEYLPVLRAIIGVVAGGISFNYDEIVQLRIAVSEAFELAIKYVSSDARTLGVNELAVRFVVGSNRIEISIPAPGEYPGYLNTEEEKESQALLRSLADELAFGGGAADQPIVRMVKYRSAGEV